MNEATAAVVKVLRTAGHAESAVRGDIRGSVLTAGFFVAPIADRAVVIHVLGDDMHTSPEAPGAREAEARMAGEYMLVLAAAGWQVDDRRTGLVVSRFTAPAACTCGHVLPVACPVHGVPCELCGGITGCADSCGDDTPGLEDLSGQPFPGRPGYLTGRDGHPVTESEWEAGSRVCGHCPPAMNLYAPAAGDDEEED